MKSNFCFFTALSVINSHPLKIYKLTINKWQGTSPENKVLNLNIVVALADSHYMYLSLWIYFKELVLSVGDGFPYGETNFHVCAMAESMNNVIRLLSYNPLFLFSFWINNIDPNCPPTPPLTQQQSIDNKLRLMLG